MNELQISLSKCAVEGNIVRLPDINSGPLHNYGDVRKALLNAGAKYSRNTFVFPNDAQAYIDKLLGGEKVNIKKEFQFFETAEFIADKMVRAAEIAYVHKVLEPSAGQGAIVRSIQKHLPAKWIDVCEIMDINQKILQETKYVEFICTDFLKMPFTYKNHYDRIIANPPFNKNQDIDHILKMYDVLTPGGKIVTIASKHWQLSKNKKEKQFAAWLTEHNAVVSDIERGTFAESGTNISCCMIVIDK